jgi:hypothetical protein
MRSVDFTDGKYTATSQATCSAITLIAFANSIFGCFDAQDDVFDGSLSNVTNRFEGHRQSDLEQVADRGLTA